MSRRSPSLMKLGRCALVAAAMAGMQGASVDALPTLWPTPAQRLDLSLLKPPYAVVARPPSGQRFNGVDVVTLDPATLRPVTRSPTALTCLRVHASMRGEVLCFSIRVPTSGVQFGTPTSLFYAPDLTPLFTHFNGSKGLPSRARVSPDGVFSATTEFASGESYTGMSGTFSTMTMILRNGAPDTASNLETWPVMQQGRRVTAADLNLWGVTFDPRQSDHFYVTAWFAGKPHLAEGSVAAHRITALRDSVECPSFSPDGKRLAFKKRIDASSWSPAVLDLATQRETVFDVGASVDDQIEWLDNHTLVYEVASHPLIGAPTSNLMALDIAAASPRPVLWLAGARSPAFVRRR